MFGWIKKILPKIRWIKSGDGHEDPVLTMAWIGFIVIIFRVAVNELTIKLWGQTLTFAKIDPIVIAAVLGPTLGAYVANHYNNMKNSPFYQKLRKDIDGDGKEEEVYIEKQEEKKP
jgi:hypothetical protein